MVQLRLPYLAPTEYSVIAEVDQDLIYGGVALNNLVTAPAVAGMGPPSYQVLCHLEDIELFGCTPQRNDVVQLNAMRKLSPVTEEFEKESHPMSSAMMLASKSISFLAKGVPSLSSIGGATSWALGKAAGVVRFFGYGKPVVMDPVVRINRCSHVGEWNTDVATATFNLAATAANTTSINTSVGYSDVDEMSLKYVTSRWAQINVFEYGTNVPAGSRIYTTVVSPMAFWFRAYGALPAVNFFPPRVAPVGTNSIQPSHLFFAANSFKQWRGGVKFRFTFAKTKMHAGRVMVAFAPDNFTKNLVDMVSTSTIVNVAAYGASGPDPFAYSAIFDLKDGNVFEFEVPYISRTPYSNIGTSIGSLVMYVVNPLVAPSVVSDTIDVLVEVAGMPDFELANPVGILYPAHNQGTPFTQSLRYLPSPFERPTIIDWDDEIEVQAGRVLSEAPDSVDQLTMGETITSVKQLIAMPHFTNDFADAPASVITIPPWFYQPNYSVLPNAPGSGLKYSFSYGGNWASCYGFLKGGTDLHVYSPSRNTTMWVNQLSVPGGWVSNKPFPYNRGHSNAPIAFSNDYSLHVRLPNFFPVARMVAWAANAVLGGPGTWGTNPYDATKFVSLWYGLQAIYKLTFSDSDLDATERSSIFYSRNAADDAQLAMYIGPPPVWVPTNPDEAVGSFDPDGINIPFL
jgi:hypothetical protein